MRKACEETEDGEDDGGDDDDDGQYLDVEVNIRLRSQGYAAPA